MERHRAVHIRSAKARFGGDRFSAVVFFTVALVAAGLLLTTAAVGEPVTTTASHLGAPDVGRDARGAGRNDTTRLPLAALWDLSEEPIVLDGYTDIANFDVSLPAGWELEGTARFDATVHASEIAGDDAALRVDIAGRPVTSWRIDDGTDLRVEVPADGLGPEPMEVVVATTSPLIVEASCPDPNHVGRWFDIGRPTISGAILPAEDMGVADAVRGMAQVSALTKEPLVLSLASDATASELDTAGALVAAIGQHFRPHGWVVADDGGSIGSTIAIRLEQDLPARAWVDVTGSRPVLNLEGSELSLPNLAHALADPDRLPFFTGTDVALATSGVPAVATPPTREIFSFGDGGYGPRTLRGYGTQGLQYQVRLPAEVVPDKAVISLNGSFGPQLGNHEAAFTVTINGGDPENVALADDSGRLAVLHDLDPTDLRPGLNYIGVHVQLGIPRAPCAAVIGAEPSWFTVSPSSALAIRQSEDNDLVTASVAELRFALATPEDFTRTDIVIPDADGSYPLINAANLISEMSFRAGAGAPQLVREPDLNPTRHLVLVGGLEDPDLMSHVPEVQVNVDLGVASIAPSPLSSNRLLVAFTGGTQEALERTIDAAMSSAVNHLDEEAGLVGDGAIRVLDQDPSALENPGAVDSAIDNALDTPPSSLPYIDIPGPSELDYEDWILKQAAKIAAARAPETDFRRAVAISLLLVVSVLGGLLFILKLRKENDTQAEPHG